VSIGDEYGDMPGGMVEVTWDEARAAAVRHMILEAFPNTSPAQDPATLVYDVRYPEPQAIAKMASGRSWREWTLQELASNRSMSNWVTDEGFVVVLPAFLYAALESDDVKPEAGWVRESTYLDLSPLTPGARTALERRSQLFDVPQLEAICAWLQMENNGETPEDLAFWSSALERAKALP